MKTKLFIATLISSVLSLNALQATAQDDNSFSLELTTLTYNNVEQVTYAYSINDEGWKTLAQGQNVLSFAHLPAGKYQFRVKALYNGLSSAEEEFMVEIRPAWYASWPAKFVYLVLLVWAFYAYLAYRKRKEQEAACRQRRVDEILAESAEAALADHNSKDRTDDRNVQRRLRSK